MIISMAGCDRRRSSSWRPTPDMTLPADNADDLGRWFADSANSGSLVRYLETFDHTIAVMQTAANLRRVAREFVEDLAADGVDLRRDALGAGTASAGRVDRG